MNNNQYSAAILIIGNEILSGRTQEKNVQFIAQRLTKAGVFLHEVAIIPDQEEVIISYINEWRKKYTYIFTTGGIGPTHDDITISCVAKAFGVRLIKNKDAAKRIEQRYKETGRLINKASLKMAYIPENATLISNNISSAPGFVLENVFVMAGIPSIVQSTFDYIERNFLKKSDEIHEEGIKVFAGESVIAEELEQLQESFEDLQVGSYPSMENGSWVATLIMRGKNHERVKQAVREMKNSLSKLGVRFQMENIP